MEETKSKAKKVAVRIPKGKDSKGMNFVPVCINGRITKVMKGVSVEVDEQVAKILETAGYLDN